MGYCESDFTAHRANSVLYNGTNILLSKFSTCMFDMVTVTELVTVTQVTHSDRTCETYHLS